MMKERELPPEQPDHWGVEEYSGEIGLDQPEITGFVLEGVIRDGSVVGRSIRITPNGDDSPMYGRELREKILESLVDLHVVGDLYLIKSLVAELIANARIHSKSGPVKATITVINSRLEIVITVFNEDDQENEPEQMKIRKDDSLLEGIEGELSGLKTHGRGMLIINRVLDEVNPGQNVDKHPENKGRDPLFRFDEGDKRMLGAYALLRRQSF